MDIVFYISAAVAAAATFLVVTRLHAVHALLYLVVSLLSVAVIFYALGASYAAALEAIVYAGAIMVLFVFVIMLLRLGREATAQESQWLRARTWVGPGILAAVLAGEVVAVAVVSPGGQAAAGQAVAPVAVGASLLGPYLLGVELASMLLLAGLVGAYHLARPEAPPGPPRKGH